MLTIFFEYMDVILQFCAVLRSLQSMQRQSTIQNKALNSEIAWQTPQNSLRIQQSSNSEVSTQKN